MTTAEALRLLQAEGINPSDLIGWKVTPSKSKSHRVITRTVHRDWWFMADTKAPTSQGGVNMSTKTRRKVKPKGLTITEQEELVRLFS